MFGLIGRAAKVPITSQKPFFFASGFAVSSTSTRKRDAVFELTGQTAIVTGDASGIGEAIARRLSSASATVAIAGNDAQLAADAAKKMGNCVFAAAFDITKPASVTAALRQVLDRTRSIEIVVNSAGVAGNAAPFWRQKANDWKK